MSETSIRLTSVFCPGPLIHYCVFTKKRPVVAIINQPGTASGKGQSQLLIIDLFICYRPKLRRVTWSEVGPETFCVVVLVDASKGLCLQFPIRWGKVNTFSQLRHITNILSQQAGRTCKQRRNNFVLCSFRKSPFSTFKNNSWGLPWFIDSTKYAGYLPQQWIQNFSYLKNRSENWMKTETSRFPEETILWCFLVLIKTKVFWWTVF